MPAPITSLTRRGALSWLTAGATASLLPSHMALAGTPSSASPDDPRLVVVMLRGALDGLAAVPALGDPAWATLRGDAERTNGIPPALALDGMFGLHPALTGLHQWYKQKEALVLHAIASPYRERSHFDAQQLLESGGARAFDMNTGWLGRALQAKGATAMALTPAMPLALRGGDGASTWTPAQRNTHTHHSDDLLERVASMYSTDTALASALAQARGQAGMAEGAQATGDFAGLAQQAGRFLATPAGPRVAWLEAGGWDTHAQQTQRLARQLGDLNAGLLALREGLGAQWAHTTVLVMTEFGRSATLNGTGGTDHGTGGVAVLAGGAVAGGRVLADWPGLAANQLLEKRDLRPTTDIRALLGAVVQHQFALNEKHMTAILPGAPKPLTGLWRT